MSDLENKNTLQKWLEFLQQESWQLELLISGFSILLLFGAKDPISSLINYFIVNASSSFFMGLMASFGMFLLGAWLFLVVNLIIHVILRGLWIGTIGLRYVSREIDFDALGYSPKFTTYLRDKIGSYDNYIERLEKLCSIIFAFSFLIIFVLFSFIMFIAFIALFQQTMKFIAGGSLNDAADSSTWTKTITYTSFVFVILFSLGGLLYFIDFLTLGFFKKKKRLSTFYFPIYRFYSLISLSFLYRPIYYNFIDNKYGRRFAFFTIPYIISLIFMVSLYFETSDYLPEYTSKKWMNHSYYDDQRKENKIVKQASIQSKIIKDDYLELFIRVAQKDEVIKLICPNIDPINSVGIKTDIVVINKDTRKQNLDSLKLCFDALYNIHIDDSLYQKIDYEFLKHPNQNERGLYTILNIKNLKEGKHNLKIETQKVYRKYGVLTDSLVNYTFVEFPFWKY